MNKILYDRKVNNYLIKIDVEGAEKIVLKELMKTNIFKFVSSTFIEINNQKDFKNINKMLAVKNFKLIKNLKPKFTRDY